MVKSQHLLGAISSRIKLPPDKLVRIERIAERDSAASTPAIVDGPTGQSLAANPRSAARRRLESPLNFPPLSQATVPGDHLTITIDQAVPCAASIVRGVTEAACDAGIEPDAITIVTDSKGLMQTLRAELVNGAGDAPRVIVHDPEDPKDLCLVGLMEKNEWLLVNRAIHEADVVLPIGCARLPEIGGGSAFDSLFPRFCDAATIARLRTPSQRDSARQAAVRRKAEKAGWLVGVPMAIQVVPGPEGTVADIVAGEPQAVAKYSERICRQLWSFRVPHRASLVIATVTGGPEEQNWDNIARALAAAESLVQEGGAVAICSNLDDRPGQSLGRLMGSPNWDDVERDARNDHSADSWPAWQLVRALQRGPVYFLSQLDDQTVEDLGMAPVANIDELARLAGSHASCIVLDEAQHAVATVANES